MPVIRTRATDTEGSLINDTEGSLINDLSGSLVCRTITLFP